MVYWTLDYFKLLYEQYTISGISVREFCRAQGIKDNRFYYWIKTLKRNTVSALESPKEFIPIISQMVNSLTRTSMATSNEKRMPTNSNKSSFIVDN